MLTNIDAEDLDHKYVESILYYGGKPVYITDKCFDGGGWGLHYRHVGAKFRAAVHWASIKDPEFTEGPFRLGYVNCPAPVIQLDKPACVSACFTSRAPVRRWKQGLTMANMVFQRKGNLHFNTALALDPFTDMLRGVYPTPRDTLATVKDGPVGTQVAFHRHWAVGRGEDVFELHYRGSKVGESGFLPKLAPSEDYQYLNEYYEAAKERA